ncbi:AAA domain-containing protein [Crassisporium funariophilum]|nr:AAA domain-containing protein [Crassisporium funariophilum]
MSISSSNPGSSESSQFELEGQVVLILCGLIASGKSTFAESLQRHYPQFRRCNQDDLGDRLSVENLTRQSLGQGLSVCIDRTNFNASQRSYWIEIAREFPETVAWVIVFDTPYESCVDRLQKRTSHPTIKSLEQGLSVLSRFAHDFQYPAPHEGYHRILYVKPSDHPYAVYSRSDIAAILLRVRDSRPVLPEVYQPFLENPNLGVSSFRGNTNRGRRGGWVAPNQYYRVPGGRGSSSSAGPSNDFRGRQTTMYRGNSVGVHGAGRSQWHNPSGMLENQTRSSEIESKGTGSPQDLFVID